MSETINLVKGQKVDLTKTNPGLTKLNIGLGWDVNQGNGPAYDLDAFALVVKGGKLHADRQSVVFFNNKNYHGVACGPDNLTGQGDGDDESVSVDLSALPSDCDEVTIGVNIYESSLRGNQQFGMVKNAYIRALNADNNTELIKYDLSEDYSGFNGVIFGKLYKHNEEWKFESLGIGSNGDIFEIANKYTNA